MAEIDDSQWRRSTYAEGNTKPNYFPISFSSVMSIFTSLQHNMDDHADSENWYYLTNSSVYIFNEGGGDYYIFTIGV